MPKKVSAYTLTFLDSQDPGFITLDLRRQRMTIAEAAQLSEQLRDAVRASGYDYVARKREGR